MKEQIDAIKQMKKMWKNRIKEDEEEQKEINLEGLKPPAPTVKRVNQRTPAMTPNSNIPLNSGRRIGSARKLGGARSAAPKGFRMQTLPHVPKYEATTQKESLGCFVMTSKDAPQLKPSSFKYW